jgi:hypothetical protein
MPDICPRRRSRRASARRPEAATGRKRRQRFSHIRAVVGPPHLRPVATACDREGLHIRSILRCLWRRQPRVGIRATPGANAHSPPTVKVCASGIAATPTARPRQRVGESSVATRSRRGRDETLDVPHSSAGGAISRRSSRRRGRSLSPQRADRARSRLPYWVALATPTPSPPGRQCRNRWRGRVLRARAASNRRPPRRGNAPRAREGRRGVPVRPTLARRRPRVAPAGAADTSASCCPARILVPAGVPTRSAGDARRALCFLPLRARSSTSSALTSRTIWPRRASEYLIVTVAALRSSISCPVRSDTKTVFRAKSLLVVALGKARLYMVGYVPFRGPASKDPKTSSRVRGAPPVFDARGRCHRRRSRPRRGHEPPRRCHRAGDP